MVELVKMAGLEIAEAVFDHMKRLLEEWQEKDYILTYGFANNKCTGYHLSANRRGITVINNPITDEIRLVYGLSSQFHPDTNICRDDAQHIDLHPDDAEKAAKLVIGWLLRGAPPILF